MSTSPRLFHPKSPFYCDALCHDIVHPLLPFCSLAGLCACSLHLLTCARGLATTGSPLPRRCALCWRDLHTLCRLILREVVLCGHRWSLIPSWRPLPRSPRRLLLYSIHLEVPLAGFSSLPLTYCVSAVGLCLPALLSLRTLPSEFICQCHVTITTVNQPKSHLQHGSCFPAAASHRTHPPARVTGVAAQRDRS